MTTLLDRTHPIFDRTLDLTNPSADPLAGVTEVLVGHLAVCSIGYLGKVEGRAFCRYGKWAWVGVSLHGQPWSSTRPVPLQAADEAQLAPLFAGLTSGGRLSAGLPAQPDGTEPTS